MRTLNTLLMSSVVRNAETGSGSADSVAEKPVSAPPAEKKAEVVQRPVAPKTPVNKKSQAKKPETDGKKPTVKAVAPVKPTAGKAAFNDDLKITLLVAENPKYRDARRRFGLYKTGMTVGEYVKANKPADRADRCYRDLAWDRKQGWIAIGDKVVAVKTSAKA